MTEQEWLTASDPTPMLKFLEGKAGDRKLRLFGVASCHRIWALMLDDSCRNAVEASEQYADGLISETTLDHRSADAEEAFEDAIQPSPERNSLAIDVAHAASYASSPSLSFDVLKEAIEAIQQVATSGQGEEQKYQALLMREIFGNPFRPVAVSPNWPTTDVLALAEGIYADRAFDRMPILADALQDAGCDNPDVLTHCRDTLLTHVRGCWVIDLLTGRK